MRRAVGAMVVLALCAGTAWGAGALRPVPVSPADGYMPALQVDDPVPLDIVRTRGATLLVPDDHATIQAAIAAAVEGDTVVVSGGPYAESPSVTKGLTLRAANGEMPAINGIIVINASNVTIDGFAITGGAGAGLTAAVYPTAGKSNITVQNCLMDGTGKTSQYRAIETGSGVPGLSVLGCTIVNWPTSSIYLNPTAGPTLIHGNVFANNVVGIGSDGQSNLTLQVNTFDGNTAEGLGASAVGTGVVVRFNTFVNTPAGAVAIGHYGGQPIVAEKNWWGTTVDAAIAPLITGNVDYTPILLSDQIRMAFGGHRLAETQNPDGGWGWPLSGTSAANTIGPIAMGLAKAYQATGDPDLRAALQDAGAFLLAKLDRFSPSDGYLAAELDAVFGGTTYVTHVQTYFYGPLAAGTYQISGVDYDTAAYVNRIRTMRSGTQANLAAWDIGMGLVGAASCGADTQPWIDGAKAEIDELDASGYYDVLGLAGALYGLAFVGEEFDPTAGEHAAAGSLADLADVLASYQITATGGFAWNAGYVIPYDGNETVQETGYAILALEQVGGHGAVVADAKAWLAGFQTTTGGWTNYVGSGENNEITAEALWGIWGLTPAPTLELQTSTTSCYNTTTNSTLSVDIVLADAPIEVVGGQYWIEYDPAILTYVGHTPIAPWSSTVYHSHTAPLIQLSVGILPNGVGAQAGTMATLTFTVIDDACTAADLVRFVTVAGNPPARLSDRAGSAIYAQMLDLPAIAIDGTPPVLFVPADVTLECDEPTDPSYTGTPDFAQGFEENRDGWFDYYGALTRLATGTGGVSSASGSYHAEVTGAFTRWGGYQSVFPTGGYTTSIDVYLDVDAALPNDSRFDYTSAINTPTNGHRRDFVISGGYYADTAPYGSGPGYIFSASNNTPGWPANPGRAPFAINVTGWYTLEHRFYDAGGGVLAVDMVIRDAAGTVLNTWTLSDPTDIIGSTVGGNRYGWLLNLSFPLLIDNTTITRGQTLAFDNCDAAPIVSYEDAITPSACPASYTIARTWKAVDACGNAATAGQPLTVQDTGAPSITCAPDVTVNADAGTCEAILTELFDFESESPYDYHADPNCVAERSSLRAFSGDWAARLVLDGDSDYARVRAPLTVVPGLTLGNVSVMFQAYIEPGSTDNLGPYVLLDVDTDFDGVRDDIVIAFVTGAAPYAQGSWYTDGLNADTVVHIVGGRPGLGATEFSSSHGGGLMSDLSTHALGAGLPWGAVPVLYVRVGAGLWPGSEYYECFVDDIFVAKALDVPAVGSDDCSAVTITGYEGLTGPFPAGTATITWTATDACGNSSTCDQTVTVNAVNELLVNLELLGVGYNTFERCIEFALLGPDGPQIVKQVVTFTNGRADGVVVPIPCGMYTCIRARDPLHSLWSADTAAEGFGIVGTQYVADFTNDSGSYDNRLVLGNLNSDEWVDVLDFAIYVVRFGQAMPLNVDCTYTAFHPDFDGSMLVDSADFVVIQTHFLSTDDAGCGAKAVGSEPVLRIHVRDLMKLGMAELIGADLNGDGWVDEHDIAAFAAGALPDGLQETPLGESKVETTAPVQPIEPARRAPVLERRP